MKFTLPRPPMTFSFAFKEKFPRTLFREKGNTSQLQL